MVLGKDDVFVVTFPGKLVRGKVVADRHCEPETREVVRGCRVQPGASRRARDVGGRETSEIRWTVYAPGGAPIMADSFLEWDKETYRVDGVPQRLRGRILDVLEVALVDWRG